LKLNIFGLVPLTFALDRDEDIFQQKFKMFIHLFNKYELKLKDEKEITSKNKKKNKINKSPIQGSQISNISKNKHLQNLHKNYLQNAKKEITKKYMKSKTEINYQNVRLSKCMMDTKNLWLIKPTGYNRGFGIEIFENLDDLKKHMVNLLSGYQEKLKSDKEEITRSKKNIKSRKFVIQKYIEKPLLYKQKKFDMR
jgi:hypothetical protein